MRTLAALGLASALALSSPSYPVAYAQSPCDALPGARQAYSDMRDFDLERIADVDMSRKRLEVVVLVEDGAEAFLKVQREALGGVQAFYARYGVDIAYSSDFSKPLAHDRVLLRVRMKNMLPPGCESFEACAFSAAREVYLGVDPTVGYLLSRSSEYEEYAVLQWGDTVAHEIGHLLGLYHVGIIEGSDTIAVSDEAVNMMVYDSPTGSSLELDPLQRRIVHSFLSKGAAYRARNATVAGGIASKPYMDAIGRAIALREEVGRLERECAKR